jgi:hypothetical protein
MTIDGWRNKKSEQNFGWLRRREDNIRMEFIVILQEQEVSITVSGSCSIVGYGITNDEPSGFVTGELDFLD